MAIKSDLMEWGVWCVDSGVNLGYANSAESLGVVFSGGSSALSDDKACIIDRAVSALGHQCRNDPKDLRYQILVYSYLYNCSDSWIAKKFRKGRNTIRTTRLSAEHWVENKIQ